MREDRNPTSGLGTICFVVFVVFLILRLTGVIDWSWVYVTMPLWLPVCVLIFVLSISFIISVYMECKRKRTDKGDHNNEQ